MVSIFGSVHPPLPLAQLVAFQERMHEVWTAMAPWALGPKSSLAQLPSVLKLMAAP